MLQFDLNKPDAVEIMQMDYGTEETFFYDYGDMGKCVMNNQHYEGITVTQTEGQNYTDENISTELFYSDETINACFLINSTGTFRCIHNGKADYYVSNNQFNVGYHPNSKSRHYTSPKANLHAFRLSFDKAHLDRLLSSDEGWKQMFLSHLENDSFYLAFTKTCANLTTEMQQVIFDLRYPTLTGNGKVQFVESKAMDLLGLFIDQLKHMNGAPVIEGLSEKDKQKIRDIHAYLTHNYINPEIRLSSLCREFGLNEFKLKKGFKQMFDETVFGYIMGLKMAEARQLLLDSAMNITEVSEHLGYSHPGHFSKEFKKRFQIAPSVVKKQSSLQLS